MVLLPAVRQFPPPSLPLVACLPSQESSHSSDTKALQLGLLAADMERVKADVAELGRIQRAMVEGVEQLMGRQLDRLKQGVMVAVEEKIRVGAKPQDRLMGRVLLMKMYC